MADEPGKQSYCLIRGVFCPEDARQVLMTLIEDKISFHKLNNWSRRERFGEPDTAGSKRIDELRQTKADLAEMLEELAAAGLKLRINCNIEIAPAQE
jgi:hypothetical protein